MSETDPLIGVNVQGDDLDLDIGGPVSEDPPYLHKPMPPLKRFNALEKIIYGHPPTQHEHLFVFGHHGPEAIHFILRLLMLLNSIYVAVTLTLLITKGIEWTGLFLEFIP